MTVTHSETCASNASGWIHDCDCGAQLYDPETAKAFRVLGGELRVLVESGLSKAGENVLPGSNRGGGKNRHEGGAPLEPALLRFVGDLYYRLRPTQAGKNRGLAYLLFFRGKR